MKVRTSTFVHGACWHRRDVTVLDNSRATRLIEQLCPQCHVVLGGATVELDAIELSCEERVHKTLSGNLAIGEHGIPTETHAPSAQRFTSPMYPGRPLYVSTIGVHPTRHWFISTAATSKSGRDKIQQDPNAICRLVVARHSACGSNSHHPARKPLACADVTSAFMSGNNAVLITVGAVPSGNGLWDVELMGW